MRGKERCPPFLKSRLRITPAYAGKSDKVSFCCPLCQDHPCICGEKDSRHCADLSGLGSPLHMRGKEYGIGEKRMKARITPAYAGKRTHRRRLQAQSQDHPCICGEKALFILKYLSSTGSPLHMRGKAFVMG